MFLAGDAFLDAITIVYFYFQKKTKVDHLNFLFLFVFGIAGKKNSLVAENKIEKLSKSNNQSMQNLSVVLGLAIS